MSPNALRWMIGVAVTLLALVLVGEVVLLGLIPVAVVAVIVTFLFAADRGAGPEAHVQSQVRRQLLMGGPDAAVDVLVPMLTARTTARRRYAAEMIAVAVQAGARDPRILEAIPRLSDLAPSYRLGRALLTHDRAEEALAVLTDAADGHDPVAWAEYVRALALIGDLELVESHVAATTSRPSVEAAINAVRHIESDDAVLAIREGLARKLGEDAAAVMVVDAHLQRFDSALPAFIASHQTTTDGDLAAWVAWAAAILGSPVAFEHLERLVSQAASGRTSVALMMASTHMGHPEIALRIAPGALRHARVDVRGALHLAHAQALAAAESFDEAVQAMYLVPTDMALVAAITPPLSPGIRTTDGYPTLVDHITNG